MERRTLEENRENKRDYAVLVGLRSPVLREDLTLPIQATWIWRM